jgi:hypothetical protein
MKGFGLLFLLAAVGCFDIQLRVGTRPNVEVLETTLKRGESTMANVTAALGQPTGTGRTMLPIDPAPRTTWTYYYEEGSVKDDRRMFLFVYFDDQERYTGYMWFSSLAQ